MPHPLAPDARPLLSVAEMRSADARAIAAGTSGFDLMRRAGRAVADRAASLVPPGGRMVVLAGPGNNGGDGFVAAADLAERGFEVQVACLVERTQLTGDAALAAALWTRPILAAEAIDFAGAHLIIDALFGAGLTRALDGTAQVLVARANASSAAILAVDLPSGVNGDSGVELGAAIRAASTITFVAAKTGHHLYPGRALAGELVVADIGIGRAILEQIGPACRALTAAIVSRLLRGPAEAGHKYDRGHALVVAGPLPGIGAPRLAARAALRVGAGLVTLAVPADALAAHAARGPDALMLRVADDPAALASVLADRRITSVAIGPAFGVGAQCRAMVETVLASGRPAVLDADALTSFGSAADQLAARIRAAGGAVVLTPHEGEFARLWPALAALPSKLERASAAARLSGAVVLLKGADTVVAAPNGYAAMNTSGTRWLATAGSGDVLTGVIAGLLATGMSAFEAASLGAWLHGRAGERAGPGLIADDLPEAIRDVVRNGCDGEPGVVTA